MGILTKDENLAILAKLRELMQVGGMAAVCKFFPDRINALSHAKNKKLAISQVISK